MTCYSDDDGKIVAAGSVEFFFIGDRPQNAESPVETLIEIFALARYNDDGSLDQPSATEGMCKPISQGHR